MASTPDSIGVEDDGTRFYFEFDRYGALEEAWYFYADQTAEQSLRELTKVFLPMVKQKMASSN